MIDFKALSFTHDFVKKLTGEAGPNEPRQVKGAIYSLVDPTPMPAPKLLGWSRGAAALFDLKAPDLDDEQTAAMLVGSKLLPGMKPYAACYGGYQFGNWAAQLGDGRAISLGEARDSQGQAWEFQLKGAGRTPYSRRGDGRAVLRSSIREFVCSEAMHALGVPTTRALSVALTGEEVVRDMFYSGNPLPEIGAVVCRLSPSFVRFGNFELFASRGEVGLARELADYVIRANFPEIKIREDGLHLLAWFEEIARRTARLILHWMRVGFVHGVMNTDNMSILGLTIDYGPYGWLENYDPSWTPNTTDLPGRRYAFGRQPTIAHWNLAQLARAILVLLPGQAEALQAGLGAYEEAYNEGFTAMMGEKLGLGAIEGDADFSLLVDMEALLTDSQADMTLFYRGLSSLNLAEPAAEMADQLPAFLDASFYETPATEVRARWASWIIRYRARAHASGLEPDARKQRMEAVNPLYVPRNYLLQEAIELAERGDASRLEALMDVLRNPYVEQTGKEAFAMKRPEWARDKPGCSTLSCSS
ncbi:MAG: YdiU family protein [Proteobacteria bacterium]|nr:MAG: YdiU family protein [Pseudomonadota bacterium]